MTLDQCYQANVGKTLLIPGGGAGNEGQCVQWADTVLHDVYGFDYHWGNAIDWWRSPGELLNHFDKITDGSVKKGDFVIFNEQVGSVYGHIDVAMQDGSTSNFQGADSNWGGNKTVHLVQHTNPSFVLGSLRLKGGQMSDFILTNGEIDVMRVLVSEIEGFPEGEVHAGKDDGILLQNFVGVDLRKVIRDMFANSTSTQYRADKVKAFAALAAQGAVSKQQVIDYINKHLA